MSSKEQDADFARHCFDLGYRAFKVHGWSEGNAREEAENVLHVAEAVGDRMTLMLDPACELDWDYIKEHRLSLSVYEDRSRVHVG